MNELLRKVLFLPEQASDFARDVDRLHYFVIITTVLMSVGVGLTALFFFVRYRRRASGQRTPSVKPPLGMEVLFVVVPLVFFLVWLAIGLRDFVGLSTPPKDAMDVYVMGKQWMWKFSYPEGPNGVDILRVPQGRPVRLLLTSRDVIHSFYVPALRLKQDVLPGRYTQTWFRADRLGRFPVFCTEYCGLSHSGMLAELVVMEGPEFEAWMAAQRRSLGARQDMGGQPAPVVGGMVEEGRLLALQQGCAKCHSIDGSAHIGPTWLDLFGRAVRLTSGETVVADETYLTESMMDPTAKLVAGYPPAMPTYRGLLEPTQTAALVEYIKSLRSVRPEPPPSPGVQP